MIVDSFRFLPRSFRSLYEGRGPLPGEEAPVWAPFEKRLSQSRIALLSSAGLYLPDRQEPFDLEGERTNPDWGDPTWRAIPADANHLSVAHLHINPDDLQADPEVALPSRALQEAAEQGFIGSTADQHVAVMGYQDRGLEVWKSTTAPQITDFLRDQQIDGLILAPV